MVCKPNISKYFYLLLLLPTIVKRLETGQWSMTPQEIVSNLILTCCIAMLIWLLCKKSLRLQYLNKIDELAELDNKHYFEIDLASQIAIARRLNSTLTLNFIDIDKFKCTNDQLGYQVGDEILKKIGIFLHSNMPHHLSVYECVSNDKFSILLQPKDIKIAKVIEKIRTLEEKSNELLNQYGAHLSVGIAALKKGISYKAFWFFTIEAKL